MKNTSRIWRLFAAVAVLATAAACSDGELTLSTGPSISPPPPVVLKFEANPPQVEVGGSTTLIWEVEDADTVEIASAAEDLFQFHAGPFEELSGSTVVDGITDTTDFILTAYKTVYVVATGGDQEGEGEEVAPPAAFVMSKSGQIEIPAPVPSPVTNPETVTATATVTVTVVASGLTADITADKENIFAGEKTAIRWTVTPENANVTVTAGSGERVVAAADCTDVSGTVEGYPAVGCASVSPVETTTYTLRAVDESGAEATDAVTITVSGGNVNADIMVNGSKNAQVQSFTDPVHVTWTVTPENALVTVTPSTAAECTPELPEGVVSASGSSDCRISANTTFSIKAELGSSSDTDDANVSLLPTSNANLDIKADPWAFVSEEVEIEVSTDEATAQTIQSIKIGSAGAVTDKTEMVSGIKKRVRVPDLRGVKIEVMRTGAATPEEHTPVQNIIPLLGHQFFHGVRGADDPVGIGNPLPVTRVAVDSNNVDRFYYGVQRPQADFGEISVYRLNNFEDSKEFAIDIADPIKKAYNLEDLWVNDNFFRNDVATYPVGAVAVRENNPDWIFAGTTGVIMYTKDGGQTWDKVDVLFYARGDGYEGSHPTCAGQTQTGRSGATQRGEIVALGQVCDMIAKEDGRLIVAYDRGVVVTDNVEMYIQDPASAPWYGIPMRGETNNTYINGTVAHDLEAIEAKIFAATNTGVYVNDSGDGKQWVSFAGGAIDATKAVYALAYDKKSKKLFAGSDDGVYVTETGSASWAKTEGSLNAKVLSLAVDPAYNQDITGPVVIAGTENGVAVTRDGGKYWSVLNSDVAVDLGAVRSVAIAAAVSGSKVTYKVSMGGQGYAAGIVEVNTSTAPAPSPGGEEEEGGETGGEEGGETGPIEMHQPVMTNIIPLITGE
jgi:hypothetical protein